MNLANGSIGAGRRRSIRILLACSAVCSTPSSGQGQTNPLLFSGDVRLRFESTTRQEPSPRPDIRDPRNRAVVRFRAGVTKQINELVGFGARLATGSPDDPNTTDVTLGDFVDNLTISLDRLYLEFTHRDLFLTGGKFSNPFLTTELVWDGDVNPQGMAASYTFSGSRRITPKLTGIYYIVDEQSVDPDSYMLGGQVQLSIDPRPDLSLRLAAAYYDYRIESLSNADAGDTQSNYLTPDSTGYLSDFDLFDAIAMLEYRGLNERYPIRLIGDFVKNRGAAVNEDAGFGVDVYVGQASKRNEFRFQYGYAELETDAALAAFTHDNTTIATNYVQHTLAIEYVPLSNTMLNVTWYLYRRKRFGPVVDPEEEENEFFSRLRVNATVRF